MHPAKPVTSLSHLKYIDALRGIAFLGVLVVHTDYQTWGFRGAKFFEAGQYGVQLFFLLSAVTLFRSLSVRGRKERHPTRNYFIRRFFRIAPLFWSGIVLYYLLDGSGPRFWAPHGLHPWQFLTTATFTHGWTPASINSVVPGGWSIAIEMTFYLCLPFLFRYVGGLGSAWLATLITLLGGMLVTKITGHFLYPAMPADEFILVKSFLTLWFPSQLCVFLLGAALYYTLQNPATPAALAARPYRPALLVAGGIGGACVLALFKGVSWFPQHVLYAAAFFPLILGLSARPFSLFVNPVTCALGTLSFSGYLTHFAALRVVGAFLHLEPFMRVPHIGRELFFAATLLSALALTVLFSTATYRLIEQPGIALGKRLIKWGERQPTAVPSPEGATAA